MNAEIISVGTELLLGEIVDTNSAELAESLAALGVNVYYHNTVGDNVARLVATLSQSMERSDLVIVTGGLGPTEDDITRECLAQVAGVPLVLNERALEDIREFFHRLGREMTANNERQAYLPQGATMLANPMGTAPGIWLTVGNAHVICLPGVPKEMRAMWRSEVIPRLEALVGNEQVIRSRTLRLFGIGEADLATRVADLLEGSNPTLAPYAGNGEVRLRMTARAPSDDEAFRLMEPVEAELRARLGNLIYGYNEATLESALGELLTRAGKTIAVAESCTGGLIAHRVTNVPGSSAYFGQGWVTYSNEAKARELGVPWDLLNRHGAVSPQVAAAMAKGALAQSGADFAVATTGVAGPGGGTPAKPVGLVYFSCARKDGMVQTHSQRFLGPREDIKWRAANAALNMLRLVLLESGVVST